MTTKAQKLASLRRWTAAITFTRNSNKEIQARNVRQASTQPVIIQSRCVACLKVPLFFLCALVILALGATPALAVTAAPGWEVTSNALPTDLAPGSTGVVEVDLYNVGSVQASGSITVTDVLPPGVIATTPLYYIARETEEKPVEYLKCSGIGTSVLVCTTSAEGFPNNFVNGSSIPNPGEVMQLITKVSVSPGAAEGAQSSEVTVAGGGALVSASTKAPITVSVEPASFGLTTLDGWFTNGDGTPDTQAGSHPYELTTQFTMNNVKSHEASPWQARPAGGPLQTIAVNLPRGVIGNPTAVPRCTRQQFDGNQFTSECPAATQIGIDVARIGGGIGAGGQEDLSNEVLPVYNMVPPPGMPAQFALYILEKPVFLDASVRSGGDYGITVHATNLPQGVEFNSTTIWGVPGEASHDPQRRGSGSGCTENFPPLGHGCADPAPLKPFLTLPTSCSGPQSFTAAASTAEPLDLLSEQSFLTHDNNGTLIGMDSCDHLEFGPSISAAPDTGQADTPAGLTVDVKASQEGLVRARTEGFAAEQGEPGSHNEGLSPSDIQDTTVALPEGMVINPGQAAGLQACQPAQDAIGTEAAPSCPLASKVGTVRIETPLLFNALEGNVYILQSEPPHLQILLAASGEGVNLKLVGDVHLNEETGQLTTTFTETPELPFTDLKLAFSGGAQAALATPTVCGAHTTTSDFTSWSAPFLGDVFPVSSFAVASGPGGAGCASPLPFTPTLSAGSTTDQAGGFTDFSLLLQRGDGQQRIDGLQFKAPVGLTGELSKVPLCTNAQAEANGCPEASKIGHTVVESGPGPYPLVVPEPGQEPAPIYLTESYDGAPFGLSIVVPLHVGPFTLPTQRVRAKIDINPITTQLTVTTGELPQEVGGVPTDLREVDAVIERPDFMINPTNCDPQSFSGTATGALPPGVDGSRASAPIESRFQVGACRSLEFAPKFAVSTPGRTSKAKGAGLTASLSYPTAPQGSQANIERVKVDLPRQLPSRLTTLQRACTSAQFDANPAGCPSESKIGMATVTTPLLPVPLVGPAIFVSHGGEAFPSLTMVLQGYGVTVDLVGTTFISKAGITSTTFKTVPDVPFNTFVLTLPQGQYSALAANLPAKANGSFCGQALAMPTEFFAQNGAVIHKSTKIAVTGCPKAHKAKTKKKHKKKVKKRKKAHG